MNWQHMGGRFIIVVALLFFSGIRTPAFGEISRLDQNKKTFISDSELATFLEESNQSQVAFISQLVVKQAGQEKALYFQIGNEERRRNLNQQPILKKTSNSAPFVREIIYVTRVNRTQAIDIELTLCLIHQNQAGKIVRTYPQQIYVIASPSKHDLEEHKLFQGNFKHRISQEENYRDVRFRIHGKTNHELQLVFMNEKKSFTLTRKKEQ